MARIGDTIRPELGRADTSGILRGSMQGASALGQGIAALGAGVGANIQQRKQNEKEVTATVSRLESLKKAQDEKSPLAKMLQQGISALSDENLSSRQAAAMAAGFNQSIDDTFRSIESNIKQEAAAQNQQVHEATLPVLQAEAGVKRNMPDATVLAYSDAQQYAGNPEGLRRVAQQRMQAWRNPEAYREGQAKRQALIKEYAMAEQQAATARANMLPVAAPITEAEMAQAEFAQNNLEPLPGVTRVGEPVPVVREEDVKPGVLGGDVQIGRQPPTVADILGPEKLQLVNELLSQQPPQMPIVPGELQTNLGDGGPGVLPPLQDGRAKAAAYVQALERLSGSGGIEFVEGPRQVDPTTGQLMQRQFIKQGGRLTEIESVPVNKMTRTPAEDAQATALTKRYGAAEDRTQFAIEAGRGAQEAIAKVDTAIALLNDDDVYTGAFSGVRERILAMAAPFGFSETWTRKLEKAETLGVLLGDFVMARVAQTKGAISEKEMDLFAKWAAGGSKSKEGNLRILNALRKVEARRVSLAKEANRLLRADRNIDAVELNFRLQDWMDSKMPVFNQDEFNTLGAGGEPAGNPGTSEAAAVDMGNTLRALRQNMQPPAQQPVPAQQPAPAPQPAAPPQQMPDGRVAPPLPDSTLNHPVAQTTNRPFVFTSPHTGQAIDMTGRPDDAEPGMLLVDPTVPDRSKYFYVPRQ